MVKLSLVLCPALALCFGSHALAQVAPPPAQGDSRVAALIQQLGSNKFAERDKASRELKLIGVPAVDLLRKAAMDGDLETKRRSLELIKVILSDRAAELVLTPKRFNLHFKNISVNKAAEEFQIQTGQQIIVRGARALITRPDINLETGDTTYWQAFDRFCQVAWFRQVRPDRKALNKHLNAYLSPLIQLQRMTPNGDPNVAIEQMLAKLKWVPQPNRQDTMVIEDGAAERLPTAYYRGFRLRMLPPGAVSELGLQIFLPTHQGEAVLLLEVSPEPGLQHFSVAGQPRIDQAIDDQGGRFQTTTDTVLSDPEKAVRNLALMLLVWDLQDDILSRLAVIRIGLDEKKANTLRHLTGTVMIQAKNPMPDVLAAVDDVLHAEGKKSKGLGKATLELAKIAKQENGSYRVTVHYQLPVNEFLPAIPVVREQPDESNTTRIALSDLNPASPIGVPALLDTAGKLLPVERFPWLDGQVLAGKFTGTVTLDFRAPEGGREPRRLVLFSRQLVTVQVPFQFENVPLN
jgi:hypothetical protein